MFSQDRNKTRLFQACSKRRLSPPVPASSRYFSLALSMATPLLCPVTENWAKDWVPEISAIPAYSHSPGKRVSSPYNNTFLFHLLCLGIYRSFCSFPCFHYRLHPYQVVYHRALLWPWAKAKWFISPFRGQQTPLCSELSCIYRVTFPSLP